MQFFPIRYQRLTVLCCKFCPQIGHKFFRREFKFGVPYGNRTRVAAVKEKQFVVIDQRQLEFPRVGKPIDAERFELLESFIECHDLDSPVLNPSGIAEHL